MAAFSKKKYLLVSTLSTSLSILLLLLKLNLVNLYKTVNQKYSTCAWGLEPATLLKKRLWHRCFPVNSANFSGHAFYGTPPVCYYCNIMSVLRLHIPASASIHEETNIVFFFLFSSLVHLHNMLIDGCLNYFHRQSQIRENWLNLSLLHFLLRHFYRENLSKNGHVLNK